MINHFVQGIHFFFQGLRIIFKPGFKRYLIVPIIMNAFLLIGVLSGLALYLSQHVSNLTVNFPSWIVLILGTLFWIIYGFVSLLVGTLIFTFLTNIIAAPFYGVLAEATVKHCVKEVPLDTPPQETLSSLIMIIPRTLTREGRKFLYFLPWLLLCLVFVITPFLWVFVPFVWWGVLSWILAIQYIDYQPDNDRIPFKQALSLLKQHSMMVFGFGNVIAVAMLIPGANLFVPPAAVAGGTALWLSIRK